VITCVTGSEKKYKVAQARKNLLLIYLIRYSLEILLPLLF